MLTGLRQMIDQIKTTYFISIDFILFPVRITLKIWLDLSSKCNTSS